MSDTGKSAKFRQGSVNYLSGLAAEDAAADYYRSLGAVVLDRRWRGRAGEVDLVLGLNDLHVFVEVKKATTFDLAATRLTNAQLSRVSSAAEEYMDSCANSETGNMRIDAALVEGSGRVKIIENVTLV